MKIAHALIALCLTAPVLAQEFPKFYRLDFALKELDENKIVSLKNYSTFMSTDAKSALIRVGTKVPYPAGNGSYNYADVGVNIDCTRIQEINGQLLVQVNAEISSVAAGGTTSDAAVTPPALVVRQNRWNSVAIIPIAKATTLFSSDDLNSKRKLQLELTAPPVK